MKKAALILSAAICALMISARAADWTDANDSTITYTALRTIKGSGTQYVITDIEPTGTDIVKTRVKMRSGQLTSQETFFCARTGYMGQAFVAINDKGKLRVDRGNAEARRSQNTVFSSDTAYLMVVDFGNGSSTTSMVTLNGSSVTLDGAVGTDAYTSGPPLVLFALNNNATSILSGYGGQHHLFYFELYDSSGNLKNCLMPAKRDSDSKVGLYDTKSGKFYPQAGGTFTTVARTVTGQGVKWIGRGGDNKMSTAANWEGGNVPQEGDDLDFTLAPPLAEIDANIDATFGKVWLNDGDIPGFTGALAARAINDPERMQAYDTATEAFTFMLASQDFTWNGGAAADWNTTDASWRCNGADSAWYDNNNAIFNTAGAKATLTADAKANTVSFSQPATIDGSYTLTVPTVSVAEGVTATISAPTDGALSKTGEGSLTLGSSRTDQTTLSEGTLAMASGATLDLAKLTLGTDPAKPVSLNLGGATINADLTSCMSATVGGAAGGSVAIDNGAITNTANLRVGNGSLTLGSGADVTMNASAERWVCVGGINSANEGLDTIDASLVLDGASITKNGTKSVFLSIGDFGTYPSKGTMIVKNGGSYTAGNSVYVAQSCEGHLRIDGEESSVTGWNIVFCSEARCAEGENGYVVVTNGGTVVVNQLDYGSGNGEGYFRFDGGTLRARSSGVTLLPAHEKPHYEVGEKGGTIDNGGNNITIAKGFSGPGTINLTGSGTTTFAAGVGVGAEGGVSVASGTTLAINGMAQSSFGSLALVAGSTLDIANYDGTTPVSVGALALPSEGTVNLKLNGGAFSTGIYAILSAPGISQEVGSKFAPSKEEGLAVQWRVDNGVLMLTVGAVENVWTGLAGDGNLSNPANWAGTVVPTRGDTATINCGAASALTVGDEFCPDVIVFPETCQNVTISGENAITGISAITNLSSSTCTFEVPVAFASEINVYQTAYYYCNSSGDSYEQAGGHVRFAGGVTGTGFAEGTTRRLDGAYTIPATADWVANTTDNVWTLPGSTAAGGSSLTITGSSHEAPGTTDTSMLLMGSGNAFTTGVVRTSNRLSYRIFGEYVVTNMLEVALTQDTYIAQRYDGTYKFEELTLSDNGTGWNFYVANSTRDDGTKHLYIGAGGINVNGTASKTTALVCGFDNQNSQDVTHLHPWHGDYAINGKGGSTRDLLIFRTTYLHTDDENGVPRTVTLNGIADVRAALTVKGRGRFQVNSDGMNGDGVGGITVTDSATLAFASGADLGAGAVTVGANATLEVASGLNTFGGGLTLNDGATLAFNFTERTVTPQIALPEGKTLTVNGAMKVKIPADSKWPTGGEKILTTCGGFSEENVTLVDGAPKWVRGLSVNADGNIVLDVKPMGTRVIVR